ncbi:hypothetical protein PR048_021017 [Dryococelus australis]|uniref:PiggyBac transposable element-derived protein domain-containing protein n=1 Tax=Dryococelus australis TaxID=614101 RepID=A0ABQ9GX21_9NEOP|nr:hypothetical protein PR048_021017 [Dryococelus australis]
MLNTKTASKCPLELSSDMCADTDINTVSENNSHILLPRPVMWELPSLAEALDYNLSDEGVISGHGSADVTISPPPPPWMMEHPMTILETKVATTLMFYHLNNLAPWLKSIPQMTTKQKIRLCSQIHTSQMTIQMRNLSKKETQVMPHMVQRNFRWSKGDLPAAPTMSGMAFMTNFDAANLSPENHPLDFLCTFLTDEFMGEIVKYSVLYATQNNNPCYSLSIEEIDVFIGILYLSGYVILPRIEFSFYLDNFFANTKLICSLSEDMKGTGTSRINRMGKCPISDKKTQCDIVTEPQSQYEHLMVVTSLPLATIVAHVHMAGETKLN